MPASRITVNLAPADLPKEGGRFDLAIAIGILVASGQISADRLAHCEFLGELSLSAELRPIRGALSSSVRAGRDGATLIVPSENAEEAALATDTQVRFAAHLLEICAWLQHEGELPLATPALPIVKEAATSPAPDAAAAAEPRPMTEAEQAAAKVLEEKEKVLQEAEEARKAREAEREAEDQARAAAEKARVESVNAAVDELNAGVDAQWAKTAAEVEETKAKLKEAKEQAKESPAP